MTGCRMFGIQGIMSIESKVYIHVSESMQAPEIRENSMYMPNKNVDL